MKLKIVIVLLFLLVSSPVWPQNRSPEENAAMERLKTQSRERIRAEMEVFQSKLVREITRRYAAEPVESPPAGAQKMGTSMQLLTQTPSNLSVAQFNALIDLYDSTSINQDWRGNTSDGWRTAVKNSVVDVSGWYGVGTSEEGKVISLTLDSINLNGYLPSTIGELTDLSGLVLPNNPLLTGKIPSSIGNLTEMVYLNLANNNHTDSIPPGIGNLSNMKTWLMYNNPNLTGPLPTTLGGLTSLQEFLAADNNLTDTIPEVFGSLSQLSNLVLSGNDFTGPIPGDLDSGSNLVVLNLSDNRLSGPIPDSLGNMPHLADLFLYANKLTGSIPSSLGSISTLQNLYLSINNLGGNIPTELGSLSNLKVLHLENCGLVGGIPTEIYGLTNLTGLYLSANPLEGGLNPLIGQLYFLQNLAVYGIGLKGSLPPSLSNLAFLSDFNIAYNDFEGTIPANMMCGAPSVFQFNILNNHKLYGSLPPCIAGTTELVNISGAAFTFTDILPILGGFSGKSMLYTSQQPVGAGGNLTGYYGFPFQLEAAVDRNTAPSSRFQWFKRGPGNTETPLSPVPSQSGHTYTFDNIFYEDAGEYFYRIWNDAAPDLILTSKPVNVSVTDKDLLDIGISVFDIYCGTVFYPLITNEEGCEMVSYSWNFGDGGSSSDMAPIHGFGTAGTFTVSLEVSYRCGGSIVFTTSAQRQLVYDGDTSFPPDMLRDSLVNVRSGISRKVISASSTTYAGNWPQNHPSGDVREMQPYLNGTAGVWRREATFEFDRARDYSPQTDISSDGTFTLRGFNWEHSVLEAVPGWVRTNTATAYTPNGNEAENRDVLGVFSASLYGYGGQLLAAQGINTRYREMAYTGFEPGDERVSGNWCFGEDPLNAAEEFEVISGNWFFAVVNAPQEKLAGVDTVTLLPRGGLLPLGAKTSVPVLCMEAHPDNDRWTILVFGRRVVSGLWAGSMVYNRPLTERQTAQTDSQYSHSGKGSLKISGTETFKQDILRLDTAKSYHISLWMSKKENPSTPVLEGGVFMELVFRNQEGLSLGSRKFYPSGPVVEQWQQVKGDFVFPVGAAKFDLVFSSGTNPTVWVDDLRLIPTSGNMESYVYDHANHRLSAVLNAENFGTFYYYDLEGNLRLVKKETVDGIMTLSETEQYLEERE